jgi:hypothetical protein
LSLIDQFEVQFNELSNFELSDGSLTEVQPVEIAGVVNQEINRIEKQLTEFDTLDSINIHLSNHDHKRLSQFYPLIIEGMENLLKKTAELKRLETIGKASVNIIQDSSLETGIIKSVPIVVNNKPIIQQVTSYVLEINGMRKELENRIYVLGRGTEADIQINDPGISRKHLSIDINEKATILDLQSTNGTFFQEERITNLEVEESAKFKIGATELFIYRETK